MRVDGGDASMMAEKMARAERQRLSAREALALARTQRYEVMIQLRKAREANAPLVEALHALVEGGVDIEFADGPDVYPDETLVGELVESIGVAYRQLERWVASLEGAEALAKLMREGPPGFEPLLFEGRDGSLWWGTANPDELMGARDGNIYDHALVVDECGSLAQGRRARRLALAPDGRSWNMSRPGGFDAGSRMLAEDANGALDVWLYEAPGASPGDWTLTVQGVDMVVTDELLRDPAALHKWITGAHAKGAELRHADAELPEGAMRLIDLSSGRRFVMTEGGILFELGTTTALIEWPRGATMHRVFPVGSPEPDATVTRVRTATCPAVFYHRQARDRRDHDRDLWALSIHVEGQGEPWRNINNVELYSLTSVKEPVR